MAQHAKRKPIRLFNTQTTEAGQPLAQGASQGSLADAIARHLQQRQQEAEVDSNQATEQYLSNTPDIWLFQQAYGAYIPKNRQPNPIGKHMNKLDVDMASGLEHLLPSAPTRYGVTKQRLEGEISAIKAKLTDYKTILASAYQLNVQTRIQMEMQSLQERLLILQEHYSEADGVLNRIEEMNHPIRFIWQRYWHAITDLAAEAIKTVLPEGLGHLFLRSEKKAQQLAYGQLRQAEKLIQDEMARPDTSPETVSTLIFQYERALQRYQELLGAKKSPPGEL